MLGHSLPDLTQIQVHVLPHPLHRPLVQPQLLPDVHRYHRDLRVQILLHLPEPLRGLLGHLAQPGAELLQPPLELGVQAVVVALHRLQAGLGAGGRLRRGGGGGCGRLELALHCGDLLGERVKPADGGGQLFHLPLQSDHNILASHGGMELSNPPQLLAMGIDGGAELGLYVSMELLDGRVIGSGLGDVALELVVACRQRHLGLSKLTLAPLHPAAQQVHITPERFK
mmetsp:Transcript_128687/g.293818  ORF Transcript_128687/g.293818 Transcript_128687/m.293818 type:complete len:227 (-) Transcript_128687:455-1135(-)